MTILHSLRWPVYSDQQFTGCWNDLPHQLRDDYVTWWNKVSRDHKPLIEECFVAMRKLILEYEE